MPATAHAFVPPTWHFVPKKAPVSWVGTWETDWGELVFVTQTDGVAVGHYAWGSPPQKGRLAGTIDGDTLRFTWTEGGSFGRGVFVMTGDRSYFVGTWGTADSDSDGGAWSGRRR